MIGKHKAYPVSDRIGYGIEFVLVLPGKDDTGEPGTAGGQHLVFDPAHGQQVAAQRNLPREATAVAMAIPADGPSLGTAPSAHVRIRYTSIMNI